jgi:hypothetical protein
MGKGEAFIRLPKTEGLLGVQNPFLTVWVGEEKEDGR